MQQPLAEGAPPGHLKGSRAVPRRTSVGPPQRCRRDLPDLGASDLAYTTLSIKGALLRAAAAMHGETRALGTFGGQSPAAGCGPQPQAQSCRRPPPQRGALPRGPTVRTVAVQWTSGAERRQPGEARQAIGRRLWPVHGSLCPAATGRPPHASPFVRAVRQRLIQPGIVEGAGERQGGGFASHAPLAACLACVPALLRPSQPRPNSAGALHRELPVEAALGGGEDGVDDGAEDLDGGDRQEDGSGPVVCLVEEDAGEGHAEHPRQRARRIADA